MEWLMESNVWAGCPEHIRGEWLTETREARTQYERLLKAALVEYDETPGMSRRRAEIQVEELGIIFYEGVRPKLSTVDLDRRRWFIRLSSVYVLTPTDVLGWDAVEPGTTG